MNNEQLIEKLKIQNIDEGTQTVICDQARGVVRSRVSDLLVEVLSEEEQKEFTQKLEQDGKDEAAFQAWVDQRFPQIVQLQEAVMEDYVVELNDRLKSQLSADK